MFTINRIGRLLVLSSAVVGASFTAPRGASAQGKLELTPFVGNYYALTHLTTDFFGDQSNFKAKQQDAVAFGGRISYLISNTLGVEGAVGYAKSDPKLSDAQDSLSATFKGNLLTATGRLFYRPARTNLNLIVGGGIVHRGGEAWQSPDSSGFKRTSPAAVLGLRVRAVVSPKFSLSVSAEGTFYSFDIDGSASTVNSSKLQSDLVVAIGIPITLSH